jgi:RNA polymerase sigma-70 factor, ECF subfamily
MTAPDELHLVTRLKAGDPEALEAAFRVYGPRCMAVAMRILRDTGRGEDAVQEAFLALWRRRDGLTVRTAGIGPWLVVVTRNAALETWRRDTRRTARENRAAEPEPAIDPQQEAATRVEAQRVREALDQLPDEQRHVVESAYFRFQTLAQIAADSNTPLGTVKTRVRAALSRLARALEPQPS